ncbi:MULTISPECIES: iron uptake porin [unclassified Tolypothrix]|uniref:iron uptake porin n=1 Tax=unclassified Tolypothrix TaxID=2649714 RepID=UPI0005F7F1B8|nr:MULTISPECIES: iron uptake porin [unclassified Tolypothrix]MBE9085137.1 carbohydrate porin [Tolypothrix sp. LEGE 11397]UYD28532.1 carbohydrate porin [Tolypothrix sp. PCC 7712]UYD35557.1 carbohydrate porin [Tolypothrix sp. PCC 7601]BAY94888.1 S-layer region-like protein [Microchaete diplosiphon NIES-3275]
MKRYLLASAGGAGLLWVFCGLLPVKALSILERTNTNIAPEADGSSYQESDVHDSNSANNVASKLIVADGTNQKQTNEDLGNNPAANSSPSITAPSQNSSQPSNALAQVTSVSQLSDVQPTDWAFQALQSLVERYGCIAGYPNSTYRGNRAMTRYEFAAGLNACLERVNELIATATTDLVKKEDLATLQKLQEEFSAELATLRGRVDALEARTTELEANQFSTTTKLNGEAIIAAVGASGGAPGRSDPNIMLVNRVRLNLTTSFTGKDLLITGLQAHNFLGGATGEGSLQNSLGLASPILSSSSARTSFEPQFPGLNVKDLSSVSANSLQLYKLLYIFPVSDKLTLFAGTAAETSDAFPTITPFYGEGQESISRFASLNPVLRVSGGTSGSGLASAAGFIFNISPNLDFRALYGSVNANLPAKSAAEVLPGVSTTPLGSGLFSGSNVIAAQLTFKPSRSLDIGLNYSHSYHEINILGTGLISGDIGALAGVGAGTPVTLNSVGGTVTWQFSPKIAFSAYGAALFVDDSSNSVNAATTFTSWMVGVHFKDLFNAGNTAGIIFGQPLFRADASGAAVLTPAGENRATPYHLEAYYRFKVSDNISITPGAFVLFNPEGNSRNETTTVGVLRTTFTF